MKNILYFTSLISIFIITGCSTSRKLNKPAETKTSEIRSTIIIKKKVPSYAIDTKNISANKIVAFAEKLIGTKYAYGSAIKENGFDCSGFISYVFNHFKISVPRISSDFTNTGAEIPIEKSKRGDIILFAGTNPKSGVVGHMGIITENKKGEIKFIHASVSKGVMISEMNSYFIPRFVKVNRIFSVFD
ncbi:MAG: C40 family peptidase [Bacteroidota bacterium]|nr:C40 family peptidase [Bacteroidota bacterium]